jgi:hypothetical protein
MSLITLIVLKIITFPIDVLSKSPTFVEIAKSKDTAVGAYFPFDWMLTAALSSPIAMVFMWIAKEWWESSKGDKKKIREDLDELITGFAEIRAMLGHDLDLKIEKKIERAFDYYDKGRRR